MSNKRPPEESHDVAPQSGGRMKRRDLLLSGSSLVAASALSAVGLITPAQAQQPSCKVCADRQRACTKNYAGPTCKTEYQMCLKSCGKKS